MSNAPDFSLVEPAHIYQLDGIRIPGTTEMLRACGIIDSTWFNDEASARGRAVHSACHYLAEGDLDWDTLAVDIRGYVEAYESAMAAIDFYPTECERALFHPTYKYGTKPDQIGFIKGPVKTLDALVELKSGSMQDWTRLQTAFQAMARWPSDFMTKPRFGVELSADGKYRVAEYRDLEDFDDALGVYLVAAWKQKHGGSKT